MAINDFKDRHFDDQKDGSCVWLADFLRSFVFFFAFTNISLEKTDLLKRLKKMDKGEPKERDSGYMRLHTA